MAEYHIDAKNKPLGRIASEIALILQGKKSAAYNPRLPGSDRVYLKNIQGLKMTGRKFREKKYHRHTGYVGHIKTRTFEQAFVKDPRRVVREAVRHMLPKNALNPQRLKNLIFIEE